MSGPADVLYHAAKRIGYYAPDDPEPGSEAGRYWAAKTGQAWLAGPSTSIWWCMLFVSMCFDEAADRRHRRVLVHTDVNARHIRAHPDAYFVSVADAEPAMSSSSTGIRHRGDRPRRHRRGEPRRRRPSDDRGQHILRRLRLSVRGQRRLAEAAVLRDAYVIRPAWDSADSSSEPETKPSWWTDEDGVWGAQTGGRFRRVMGLTNQASWEEACKRFQTFLNWALDAYEINKLTGAYMLEVDGVDGEKTWRCFQHFWNMSDIPGDDSLLEEDGILGVDTVTKVQKTLNNSWHGSGGLAKAV